MHAIKITISNPRSRGRPPRGTIAPSADGPSEVRNALDRLAYETELTYADGRPRDAEIVRVLLVSELLADEPRALRIATSIYCNSVLALSRAFAVTTAEARANLWASAARLTGLPKDEERPPVDHPPPRRSTGKPPNREQVRVILDDWLRRRLPTTKTAARARNLLTHAIQNLREHEPVVRAYARFVRGIEEAMREVIVDQFTALTQALTDVPLPD